MYGVYCWLGALGFMAEGLAGRLQGHVSLRAPVDNLLLLTLPLFISLILIIVTGITTLAITIIAVSQHFVLLLPIASPES